MRVNFYVFGFTNCPEDIKITDSFSSQIPLTMLNCSGLVLCNLTSKQYSCGEIANKSSIRPFMYPRKSQDNKANCKLHMKTTLAF